MKYILTTFIAFLSVAAVKAQGPVWDAAKTDSNFHPLAKHHWGICLMGGTTFNTGKTVMPVFDNGLGGLYFSSYSYSNPKDNPGGGLSAGFVYETKEFSRNLYVSFNPSISIYWYGGAVNYTESSLTLSHSSGQYDSLVTSTGTQDYGYTTGILTLPILLNYCIYVDKENERNQFNRFTIGIGSSGGVYLDQQNGGHATYYSDDFESPYWSGILNFGFEHINMNNKVFRIELFSDFGLLSSPEGRRLGFVGIKLASLSSR